jgi:hypothetical protein
VKGHHILFCKRLDDPHCEWRLTVGLCGCWWALSGWDDDCPGLVSTLMREAEWRENEAHNNREAAQWAVEATDGWGNTCPPSPIYEGWPCVRVEDGTWPLPTDVVPLRPDHWHAEYRWLHPHEDRWYLIYIPGTTADAICWLWCFWLNCH